ncbi:hypothetical protein Daura_12415 [Dactylosporangium aurantiacum]|uniref:Haemophore haem-binding domain-containing protein n=1 Tax=Dactylosporangium aurantiacum TaxID=35754 RepID=A0A9Q9MF70_9ACTN|nr:hypothetical protein [Dactylosporangium aurantiacum]MDG6104082.1 hypothetical protein [Dactylosporangium aurantiacum]UWZ56903.1 hypothetical protein Daura_12415 [Dactylosporangium aurantiacum]
MIRSRRHLRFAPAPPLALLTLAALATTGALAGCGDGSDTPAKITAPSAASSAAGPSAAASLTPDRQETIFLDTTAAHLCSVQSRVYTDPAAMAEAYASRPVYAGLSDAQVEQYQQRVVADPAFAERLTGQLQRTCGSAPK